MTSGTRLQEALDAWVEQHGYIWFDGDLRFAQAVAAHLGISLEIDGIAVAEDDIPGVEQT